MTTANPPKNTVERAHLGTLSVLAWTGDPEAGHDMPYLLVYSLGDGGAGPEGARAAVLGMIEESGLAAGALADTTPASVNSPVRLLVEGGQAVLNMPYLSAQCPVPPEWLDAVEARGHAHLIVTPRVWPEAAPGRPVTEEVLRSFIGDEETLGGAAHVLLRVSRLRT
jgi:hypothetical protein